MDHHHAHHPDRRNFLTKAAAVVIGGLITVVPGIAGLMVFLDPLRRKTEAGAPVRVGSLNALPESGPPQKVQVLQTKIDIWNRAPNEPVGAIYLQRIGEAEVRALNAKCPHAGCPVNFKGDHYHCPCHDSTFALDGKILDPKSPTPRGMDELKAEVKGNDIFVRFQNFRAGVKEKLPV